MKNLLIVVGSSNIGGAEKQALFLAKNLEPNYLVTMIFLGPPGNFLDIALKSGIRIITSNGTYISDVKTIFKCVRNLKPTCQINYLYRADLIGGIVAKLLAVPKIINSARNTSWPNVSILKKLLLCLTARFIPSTIVANSPNAVRWHLSVGYPNSKIVLIQNYIEEGTIEKDLESIANFHNPVRLGIASRAVVGKGHKSLIAAIAILRKQGISCDPWFIGYGLPDWKLLQGWLTKYEVTANIRDGEANINSWFRQIDIYCGVSESWESDSNSINEAVLHELPLIVSNLISKKFYVPAPRSVSSADANSIAGAISEILNTSKATLTQEVQARRAKLIYARNSQDLTHQWERLIEEPFILKITN